MPQTVSFYVREKNTTAPGKDLKKAIIHNGSHFTAFSGTLLNIESAIQYLQDHGAFWKRRGFILHLFDTITRCHLGRATGDGSKLSLTEQLNKVA